MSELYLDRFSEAQEWFEKADQIGPRDPSRWIWLGAMGRVQFFRGRDEEAIRLLRLSADANPSDPRAYALLAGVYAAVGLQGSRLERALGRFSEAQEWFEKADQIGPRDPSRWIWLGAMGRVQFFRGRDEEAICLLRLSADANPSDPRAYALLAGVYAGSGTKRRGQSGPGELPRPAPGHDRQAAF